MFLVSIDSLPKCYSGSHFLSPRAQIALLFGPTTISASRELDRQIARLTNKRRQQTDPELDTPSTKYVGVKR